MTEVTGLKLAVTWAECRDATAQTVFAIRPVQIANCGTNTNDQVAGAGNRGGLSCPLLGRRMYRSVVACTCDERDTLSDHVIRVTGRSCAHYDFGDCSERYRVHPNIA